MKISEFFKSKRTWVIIGGGIVSTIGALFPGELKLITDTIRVLFGLQ